MRAVVQRVTKGSVFTKGNMTGSIEKGIVLLLGISCDDTNKDVDYMVRKVMNLRIFDDEEGKMNISLLDIKGELLVVSQFTLYGDTRKGNRPSYIEAAGPEYANDLYREFIDKCKRHNITVKEGKFRAAMNVEIHNDGPVTLIIDSNKII